jgi:hypothetical protein
MKKLKDLLKSTNIGTSSTEDDPIENNKINCKSSSHGNGNLFYCL